MQLPWCFRVNNETYETEVYYHGIKLQGIRSANITAESGEVDVSSATSPWVNTARTKPTVVVHLEIISSPSEDIPSLADEIKDDVYEQLRSKIKLLEHGIDELKMKGEFKDTKISSLSYELDKQILKNKKLKKALKHIINESVKDEGE